MNFFKKQPTSSISFLLVLTMLMCKPNIGSEMNTDPVGDFNLVSLPDEREAITDTITSDSIRYSEILQYLVHNEPSEKWPVLHHFLCLALLFHIAG
jgi:hypothetical protein